MSVTTLGLVPGAITGWNDGFAASTSERTFVTWSCRTTRGDGASVTPWHLKQTSYAKRASATGRPLESRPLTAICAPPTSGAGTRELFTA